MTEGFTELLLTLFSSAGLAGALFAALLSHVLRKARADADRRRQERTSLEIMRCEGEAAAGELLLTLGRLRTGTLRRDGAENSAGRIQQLFGKKQSAQGQAGRRAHRKMTVQQKRPGRFKAAGPFAVRKAINSKRNAELFHRPERRLHNRLSMFCQPSATSSSSISAKPSATPTVPTLLCSPACDSGISSSTTT